MNKSEIFEKPDTMEQMFNWAVSAPFHNYGYGISRALLDESNNPDYTGLGEIWGHTGTSDNFMFYWPKKDTALIGVFNQIDCELALYDNVVQVMKVLLN